MRRGISGGIGLIIIGVIAVLLYLSVFIVDPTQQALVLRFGQVIRPIGDPGLYYKLPLIDNVVFIDKRILDLDSQPLEVIVRAEPGQTQQQQVGQRLVVDAFGRYKIINPLLFYQAAGSIPVADQRLQVVLNSAVRRVLGDATLFQLVRDQRAQLMARITAQVDGEAQRFGVKVVDVKIRSADLPAANSQAIYQRMQTERQQQATDIRSNGERLARTIRAQADAGVTVTLANANGESSRLRGAGEARQNEIYAGAFSADPDFFAFYRSMQAYQTGLKGTGTRLVITPDSEFFKYFNDASGKQPVASPGAPVTPPAPPAAAPPSGAGAPAAAPPGSASNDQAPAP
jgi:membrane protease subunit HflC